jgi:hypothetical protein
MGECTVADCRHAAAHQVDFLQWVILKNVTKVVRWIGGIVVG